MLRPRIQAPIFSKLRAARSSSGPVAPSSLPSNLFWKVRVPRAHSCKAVPPMPRGLLTSWLGPAPNPSIEIAKPRTTSFCLPDAPIRECWHAAGAGSRCHVRFGSLADISQSPRHVRFTPESRHSSEADPGVYIGDNRKIILGISETEARI